MMLIRRSAVGPLNSRQHLRDAPRSTIHIAVMVRIFSLKPIDLQFGVADSSRPSPVSAPFAVSQNS
jgi:hypothetical protein